MLTVALIQVNYLPCPMGISGRIQLSWALTSDRRNVMQESYHILIRKECDQNVVLDSGVVQSGSTAQIELQADWESVTKYRVCVTVSDGTETAEGSTSFLTALQKPEEWCGAFISADPEEDADKSYGTYVRHEFTVKKELKEAYLLSTAHGLYQAFLNGKRVGCDEMAPGWTSYLHRLYYQSYDVKALLRVGTNAIGASLGAGWYKGMMGFHHQRNLYGNRTSFSGMLILRYQDGTEETIATDDTWKGSRSPILFSEIYDGEIYDARLEQPGWDKTGFEESDWYGVDATEQPKENLIAQSGTTVREITRVPAVKIITTPQGDTVVDFGQNTTGWCHFRIRDAAEGDVAEVHFFETLDSAGNAYFENLRAAKETVRYFCRGGREEQYHPSFTYQGFRYAKIVSWPGALTLDSLTAYAVHSDMRPVGDFACSSPMLNQLQHNIKWGMKGNFLDIPTDCPQRDERIGWTGDAEIFCRTATFLMDTYTFYSKWLGDVAADQLADGAVGHVVPDILTGRCEKDWLNHDGQSGASAWADVCIINPWNLYLAYGDKAILVRQYDSMKKWIGFMQAHSKEGCLFQYAVQFGDWVALDAKPGSYFGATPTDYTCAAFYCYSTGLVAKIAEILENAEDTWYYQNLHRELCLDFERRFFAEDHITIHTQTACIVALHFNLVPSDAARRNTIEELKDLLRAQDGHLVTGFIGTPYFTHALSNNGCPKEAYDLLEKEDFPSWLYQVKMGATTVWEHWDGMRPDGTMWSPDMNSFNHYAYGSIGEWLYRVVAGIEIDEAHPGYAHFFLQPLVGGHLRWAGAEYTSIHGKITSRWEKKDGLIQYSFSIPAGTTATVRLTQAEAVEEADGLTFSKENEGYTAQAGSGQYCITFRANDAVSEMSF